MTNHLQDLNPPSSLCHIVTLKSEAPHVSSFRILKSSGSPSGSPSSRSGFLSSWTICPSLVSAKNHARQFCPELRPEPIFISLSSYYNKPIKTSSVFVQIESQRFNIPNSIFYLVGSKASHPISSWFEIYNEIDLACCLWAEGNILLWPNRNWWSSCMRREEKCCSLQGKSLFSSCPFHTAARGRVHQERSRTGAGGEIHRLARGYFKVLQNWNRSPLLTFRLTLEMCTKQRQEKVGQRKGKPLGVVNIQSAGTLWGGAGLLRTWWWWTHIHPFLWTHSAERRWQVTRSVETDVIYILLKPSSRSIRP